MRVAIECYLRSRRVFKTTAHANTHDDDPMEVDALSRKGMKGKGKLGKGKKGGKKSQASHTGKGYGDQATEKLSYFEGECRHCGVYGHKAADCWQKHAEPRGSGKAKSKVSEVSEGTGGVAGGLAACSSTTQPRRTTSTSEPSRWSE